MKIISSPDRKRSLPQVTTHIIDVADLEDEIHDFSPELEVSFELSTLSRPPTVLDNPLAGTAAAHLMKERSVKEMSEIGDAVKEETADDSLHEPSDSKEPPQMLSPTRDRILEWLGAPRHTWFCFASLTDYLLESFQRSQFRLSKSRRKMANLMPPISWYLYKFDSIPTVDHFEDISEDDSEKSPEAISQLLDVKTQARVLESQVLDLQREIEKISLNEWNFVSQEQLILHSDAELAALKNEATACFKSLDGIQCDEPPYKYDLRYAEVAFDDWSALQENVTQWLLARSGLQYDHQMKLYRFIQIQGKKKRILAQLKQVNKLISKLEDSDSEDTESPLSEHAVTALKIALQGPRYIAPSSAESSPDRSPPSGSSPARAILPAAYIKFEQYRRISRRMVRQRCMPRVETEVQLRV